MSIKYEVFLNIIKISLIRWKVFATYVQVHEYKGKSLHMFYLRDIMRGCAIRSKEIDCSVR